MLHISNERRTFSGLPWKSHELAAVRELHVSVPWHGNGRNTSKFFNYFFANSWKKRFRKYVLNQSFIILFKKAFNFQI